MTIGLKQAAEKVLVLKGRSFSYAIKPRKSIRLQPPRECFHGKTDFFSTL
jgi:hypothetical protein